MGLFNDPGGWFKSAGEDVSDVLDSDLGKAAAVAAAVYFGLPYIPGGSELAAYASEMAGAGEALGAGGITADAALASAGATAADLGAVAGIGVAAPAGYSTAAATALGANAASSTPWYLSPTALQTGAGLVGVLRLHGESGARLLNKLLSMGASRQPQSGTHGECDDRANSGTDT